ncbi:MAG: GNAT family protein [Planctomycetota bacterium]|nr:GNAT family protein [Planctomycetota bacterium]
MELPLLSERLLVRRPTAGDGPEYLELLRASEEFHRPWFPALPDDRDPFGDEVFHGFLESDDERCKRYLLFARGGQPEGPARDTLVGVINANEIVRGVFQSAYLGYWLGVGHTGRGYMCEGLDLVIDHAFAPTDAGGLGLHRLEANIIPENAASLAVVEALGFRREGLSPRYLKIAGEWRDHERWALTVEDRDPG